MNRDALAPIGVIDHYNLLERIDSVLGELYRARDTKHGRTVAVRVLPADFTTNPRTFIETARAVQVLSHPNAITVFHVGEHEGRVYLAFEFLKGQSLRAEMAGRPVPVRRALDIAVQIADAVAEAHAATFLHGGLSPESIVITAKGHAKIPAFALAVQSGLEHVDGEPRLPDYDAPEETRGEPPDERSDVYSVGAILYEMLTMRRPLHRGSAAPGASNPRVPKELDAVVLKAVAPNPDSRYQSIVTFASDLRSAAAALEEDDVASTMRSAGAPSTSIGSVVVTSALILAVVGAILWWFTRS